MLTDKEKAFTSKLAVGQEMSLQLTQLFKELGIDWVEFMKEHEHCSVTEAQKKLMEATTS